METRTLSEYASSVRSTKGYRIILQTDTVLIVTSDNDPRVVVTTRGIHGPSLRHTIVDKNLFLPKDIG